MACPLRSKTIFAGKSVPQRKIRPRHCKITLGILGFRVALRRRSESLLHPLQSSVLFAVSVTPSAYWLSAALSAEVCFGSELMVCEI